MFSISVVTLLGSAASSVIVVAMFKLKFDMDRLSKGRMAVLRSSSLDLFSKVLLFRTSWEAWDDVGLGTGNQLLVATVDDIKPEPVDSDENILTTLLSAATRCPTTPVAKPGCDC